MANPDLPVRQPGASGSTKPQPVPDPAPEPIFVHAKKG